MKILLLNPWIDAEHDLVKALEMRGVAVLLPADGTEASQMLQLHGTSIDLAIVHRESRDGTTDDGMGFIAKFRSDPAQADLPYVLTTEAWSESDCAAHQSRPDGANAYLIQPFPVDKLVSLIEAVTGQKLAAAASPPSAGRSRAAAPSAPQPPTPRTPPKVPFSGEEASIPGLVLEDASEIFTASEIYEPSDTSIKLDMPDFAPDEVEPARAPEVAVESASQPESEQAESIPLDVDSILDAPASGYQEGASEGGIELSGGSPQDDGPPPLEIGGLELSGGGASFEMPAELPAVADELSLPTAGGDLQIPDDVFAHDAPEFGNDPSPMDDGPAEVIGATQFGSPQAMDGPSISEIDEEAAHEMPYLFKQQKTEESPRDLRMIFAQPLGDAVVPGGAVNAPDLETLKKFLLLREQDVGALSTQLRSAREQVGSLEEELRKERGRNVEIGHELEDQNRRIESFEREKEDALVGLRAEIDELNFKLKVKTDKAKILESKVRSATAEMERLKERVRSDIRKIRVREKELENRLEILKKDSEVLITARENKVIELKRRLDLLEFNMDLLQDQYSREKETSAVLREKLARAAQAMRVAGGMLDSDDESADQEAS